MPHRAYIGWSVRKVPPDVSGHHASLGYEAKVTIPSCIIAPGEPGVRPMRTKAIAMKARGRTPTGALWKAASLANKLASNPILKSILPPGTSTAIKATRFLAKAALKGKLGKALKFVRGKGAKRLVKSLKKFKFW